MGILQPVRARLAAALACVAFLVFGMATGLGSQAHAEESAAITDGTVTWGFKESWRQYIPEDGVHPSGGVSINEAGEYMWPIESGTYDADAHELTLKLGGAIQFLSHCEEAGKEDSCILNSTMKNLTLILTEGDSHIQGDYSGVPMSDWNAGVIDYSDVRIASLSTEQASYEEKDGTSVYSNIGATAGDGVKLYAEGIALDPVSIEYTGAGGLPPAEPIVTQGVPRFANAGEWNSGQPAKGWLGGWRLYPATHSNAVLQVDNQAGSAKDSVRVTTTTVRAIDVDTMKEVASASVDNIAETASILPPYASAAVDSRTDTVYMLQPFNAAAEKAAGTDRSGTLIKAFRFDGSALEESDFYRTEEALSGQNPRIYVLPERNALVLYAQKAGEAPSLRLIDLDSGKASDVQLTETNCTDLEEDWDEETESIVETEVPLSDLTAREMNNDDVVAETDSGFVRFYAQTQSIEPSSRLAEFSLSESTSGAVTATLTCTDQLSTSDGEKQTIEPYQWIEKRSDGSYFVYGAKGHYGILRHADSGWVLDASSQVSPFEVQGYEYYQEDPETGLSYLYSENQDQIWTIDKDGEVIDTFPVVDPSERVSLLTGLVRAKDGSLIYNSRAADGNEALRRLAPDGTTPVVTKDPEPITVEVGTELGDTGTAYFCAAATGTHGTLSSYWQVRAPGSETFVSTTVTGDNPSFSVGKDQDGYEYRAVYKDASGAVVTKPAALTVVVTDNPAQTRNPCGSTTADAGAESENEGEAAEDTPTGSEGEGDTPAQVEVCTRTVKEGALSWPVRAEFLEYLQGFAGGTVTVTDSAETTTVATESGEKVTGITYPAVSGTPAASGIIPFQGAVQFSGHKGVLDITMSDIRLQLTEGSTEAELIADVSSRPYNSASPTTALPAETYDDATIVDLTLAAAPDFSAPAVDLTSTEITITETGNEAFGGFFQDRPLANTSGSLSIDETCTLQDAEDATGVDGSGTSGTSDGEGTTGGSTAQGGSGTTPEILPSLTVETPTPRPGANAGSGASLGAAQAGNSSTGTAGGTAAASSSTAGSPATPADKGNATSAKSAASGSLAKTGAAGLTLFVAFAAAMMLLFGAVLLRHRRS